MFADGRGDETLATVVGLFLVHLWSERYMRSMRNA